MANAETNIFEKPAELARKAILATIGGYGMAFEQFQNRMNEVRDNIEDIREKPSDFIDQLVEKGEEIEQTAQESLEKFREESKSRVEDSVDQIRNFQFATPFSSSASKDRVAELEAEVEALNKKIATLTKTSRAKKTTRAKSANSKAA